MPDQSPARINADRLEAALASVPLTELACVQPVNLAKRLIRLRSAVEIAVAQMRAQKEPAS